MKELYKIAEENEVVLYNNITLIYLQAFGQLLWNARGNLIGDLVSIRCSICKKEFDINRDMSFTDLAVYPICAIIKILGTNYEDIHFKLIKNNDKVEYGTVMFSYNQSVAFTEIGYNTDLKGVMEIIGTNGSIIIPHEWWKIGYFKIKNTNDNNYKRYTFNLEGNGFRYLVQDLLSLIRHDRNKSQRLKEEEIEAITEILAKLK